ncbi:MAG: hypothetical protein HY981_02200 [Candidatus Magasanikbacteria bacterium]|nr:hypothetical protein [Candidatus Magasanikbacteria bacterium]
MRTLRGKDTAGVNWEGRFGDDETTVTWRSNKGHIGKETVVRDPDGTMRGTDATGDVVPCVYEDGEWTGDCPNGEYEETDDD